MPTKYAVRITEDNLDMIRALRPLVDIDVKEDQDRYFLFTAGTSTKTTTEHDVVHEDDLEIYDGREAGTRIIFR